MPVRLHHPIEVTRCRIQRIPVDRVHHFKKALDSIPIVAIIVLSVVERKLRISIIRLDISDLRKLPGRLFKLSGKKSSAHDLKTIHFDSLNLCLMILQRLCCKVHIVSRFPRIACHHRCLDTEISLLRIAKKLTCDFKVGHTIATNFSYTRQ